MTEASTVAYSCPNCGAGLTFDPEKQKFCCEFCLSDFDEADLKDAGASDRAEQTRADDEEFCSSMNEYFCPNCGAEVAVDESTVADFCYYCHNPVVLRGKLEGQLKPNKIIPFKFDKKEAENKFLSFAGKKWFAPRDFSSREHAEKISGIYYPFWVTDADTECRLDGRATKVRVWRQGDWEITETSKFDVLREGNIHFEDITSSAFSEGDKRMLEGILPFPSDCHIDFSMPYLLGFQAKKRDIDRTELGDEVRGRMNSYAKTLLSDTVNGYTSFTPEGCNVNIQSCHWEYTLMPVWVLTYKNKKGKTFLYAMNGYTGKIYGEIPISIPKVLLLGGLLFAICLALFGLIGGLL